MDDNQIIEKLKAEFPDAISEIKDPVEHRIDVHVQLDKLVDVATFIKHEMGFLIPNMCTGIDYKDKMEVSWHISAEKGPAIIVLKVETDRDNPVVPSLTPTWEGMNWNERETYDLLGVKFEGHPDLRRILLPENWEGHPLREDYVYKRPIYRKPEDFDQ